jgi:hypothetical protein
MLSNCSGPQKETQTKTENNQKFILSLHFISLQSIKRSAIKQQNNPKTIRFPKFDHHRTEYGIGSAVVFSSADTNLAIIIDRSDRINLNLLFFFMIFFDDDCVVLSFHYFSTMYSFRRAAVVAGV